MHIVNSIPFTGCSPVTVNNNYKEKCVLNFTELYIFKNLWVLRKALQPELFI